MNSHTLLAKWLTAILSVATDEKPRPISETHFVEYSIKPNPLYDFEVTGHLFLIDENPIRLRCCIFITLLHSLKGYVQLQKLPKFCAFWLVYGRNPSWKYQEIKTPEVKKCIERERERRGGKSVIRIWADPEYLLIWQILKFNFNFFFFSLENQGEKYWTIYTLQQIRKFVVRGIQINCFLGFQSTVNFIKHSYEYIVPR